MAIWFCQFRLSPATYECSCSSTFLPVFDMVRLYNFRHSTRWGTVPDWGFHLHFSKTNDAEYLLCPLIALHVHALINICQILERHLCKSIHFILCNSLFLKLQSSKILSFLFSAQGVYRTPPRCPLLYNLKTLTTIIWDNFNLHPISFLTL